jgi:hypothetical protein
MAKKTEYGKPTYARAVLARVGIGDGWGNPKKMTKTSTPYTLPTTPVKQAVTNRKKMLDDI